MQRLRGPKPNRNTYVLISILSVLLGYNCVVSYIKSDTKFWDRTCVQIPHN